MMSEKNSDPENISGSRDRLLCDLGFNNNKHNFNILYICGALANPHGSVETELTVYELFNDKKQNLQTLCSNLCGIYGENDKYRKENEFAAIRIKNTFEMEDMPLNLTIFDLKRKMVQDKSIKGVSKITDFELLHSLSNNEKFIILDNEIRLSQISILNKLKLFAFVYNDYSDDKNLYGSNIIDASKMHVAFDLFSNKYQLFDKIPNYTLGQALGVYMKNNGENDKKIGLGKKSFEKHAIYVSQRWLQNDASHLGPDEISPKMKNCLELDTNPFRMSEAWMPYVEQSRRGMAMYLCVLCFLSKIFLRQHIIDKENQQRKLKQLKKTRRKKQKKQKKKQNDKKTAKDTETEKEKQNSETDGQAGAQDEEEDENDENEPTISGIESNTKGDKSESDGDSSSDGGDSDSDNESDSGSSDSENESETEAETESDSDSDSDDDELGNLESNTRIDEDRLLGHIRALFPAFAPMILSFKLLICNLNQLTDGHKAALSNGFYMICRQLSPTDAVPNNQVFERFHVVLNYLINYSLPKYQFSEFNLYATKSFLCPLSKNKIITPVNVRGAKIKNPVYTIGGGGVDLHPPCYDCQTRLFGEKFGGLKKSDIEFDRERYNLLNTYPNCNKQMFYYDFNMADKDTNKLIMDFNNYVDIVKQMNGDGYNSENSDDTDDEDDLDDGKDDAKFGDNDDEGQQQPRPQQMITFQEMTSQLGALGNTKWLEIISPTQLEDLQTNVLTTDPDGNVTIFLRQNWDKNMMQQDGDDVRTKKKDADDGNDDDASVAANMQDQFDKKEWLSKLSKNDKIDVFCTKDSTWYGAKVAEVNKMVLDEGHNKSIVSWKIDIEYRSFTDKDRLDMLDEDDEKRIDPPNCHSNESAYCQHWRHGLIYGDKIDYFYKKANGNGKWVVAKLGKYMKNKGFEICYGKTINIVSRYDIRLIAKLHTNTDDDDTGSESEEEEQPDGDSANAKGKGKDKDEDAGDGPGDGPDDKETTKPLIIVKKETKTSFEPPKETFFRPLYEHEKNDKFHLPQFGRVSLAKMPEMYKNNGRNNLIDDRIPKEAIFVCFDRSLSMSSKCFAHALEDSVDEIERLQCAKIFFNAFINRSVAYNMANHIGLILFSNRFEVTCNLTPIYQKFMNKCNEIECGTFTAMRDAISHAANLLLNWKSKGRYGLSYHCSNEDNDGSAQLQAINKLKRRNAKLRIIVLSDGEDNQSETKCSTLVKKLARNDIIVDGVCLGHYNKSLHLLCKASGGMLFNPTNFADGIKIFELETFISQDLRPKPKKLKFNYKNWTEMEEKMNPDSVDICTFSEQLIFPEQKKVSKMGMPSVSIKKFLQKNENRIKKHDSGNLRIQRILKELISLVNEAHPFWDVYPLKNDITFWKLVLHGSAESEYNGGNWLLYLDFGKNYPMAPPTLRFDASTPMKHVNVNQYGRICHSILDVFYTPVVTIRDIFNHIYGLLLDPDWDDPLDTVLRQQHADDPDNFRISVREFVDRHTKVCPLYALCMTDVG